MNRGIHQKYYSFFRCLAGVCRTALEKGPPGSVHYIGRAGRPIGGVWNIDQENRELDIGNVPVPLPILFQNGVSELKRLFDKRMRSSGMEFMFFGNIL